MRKQDFNGGWSFRKKGFSNPVSVTLPHDAQISEERTADAPGGSGHGYFPGGVYVYEKTFLTPADWADKTVSLLFEGVYKNSTVTVNGKEAGGRPYGYSPFTVCLDGLLNYGGENTITVTADNSKLPNSRWYSGSGIYRPVSLLVGEQTHIQWQGVRITTLSYSPARIRVDTEATGGDISVEILDGETIVASGKGGSCELDIPNAKLWSDETPNLYLCHVTLTEKGQIMDEVTERFGVRVIEWSPKGLFVNGKSVLLRGGCIHHDNGILGAATHLKSEERRVRILKENGFNALRSSHNPTSTALIEACDKYGMYLMDETFDMWYNRKNKYDYGCDFHQWWEADTTAMVERDYNHPSVILYSIGNEVAEPFEKKGVDAGKAQIDLIHRIDPTRPVTCGVNLMILGRAAKGNGIYQDGEQNTASSGKKQKEGGNASLAFNMMASFIGTGMNKGGNSPKVDAIASPFVDSLDIAGYNYGSGRYPLEEKQHPNRVIFGSETFPQDIYKNWQMVKKYPYLVGDFMWTAWDYLGEAGLGAWSYTGGMPFNRPYPWLLAGAGVIDILGNPDASCKYAATVWGLTDKPVIGVRPVNHPGVRVSKSVWRGTNAMESWAWSGCNGNKAEIEVYAQADSVELLLNGKRLGRKKLKEYKTMFKTRYAPGTLTAVAYDETGRELSRSELHSATGAVRICAEPEDKTVKTGEIVYIPISLTGENGVVESNADRKLTIQVKGGELLGFGSANPCTAERYDAGSFTTYQGRALAVVRARQTGAFTLTVTDGKLTEKVEIHVR
ncbi:MAG: glycoside hydrolase family 2 TIM barrel-domain containing protein [bacterium]|nr:glycoside hydrolase family 2 TIM barrel-domain containing protein [bacterium]